MGWFWTWIFSSFSVRILFLCSLSETEICEYLTIQVHWGVQNWVARAGKHLKMDGARQSHNRIKFGCINKLSTLLTQTTKSRFTISLSGPSLIVALPLQSLSPSLLWDLTDVALTCEDARTVLDDFMGGRLCCDRILFCQDMKIMFDQDFEV